MTSDTSDPEAWRQLLLAHSAALRAIEADMTAAKVIPLSWYDVLLELRAAPKLRLRMQELADQVVLSRTRVSRLVDELVAAGYVSKERDPSDGRGWYATLTEEGRAARREAAPIYLAAIHNHFSSHLSARENQIISRGLRKVAQAHRQS